MTQPTPVENSSAPVAKSAENKSPSKNNVPDNWDLYPKIYRDYLDGEPLKLPTKEYLNQMHAQKESGGTIPDLCPKQWKDQKDHPAAQLPTDKPTQ